MADKKVDATTGEVKEQLWGDGVETPKIPEDKKLQYFDRSGETLDEEECVKVYKIHCKPTYNYQSVEFDFDVRSDNLTEDMMSLENNYKVILEMLVRVSEKAPQKDFKPVQQVEEPATEKQIEVMNTFHIKYPKDVTRKQAQELIKANISAVK
jgi:hypothetical protein